MAEAQSTAAVSGPLVTSALAQAELQEREFVLDCVERSDRKKERHVPIWDEVFTNYLLSEPRGTIVDPGFGYRSAPSQAAYPVVSRTQPETEPLRDPETHQIIESITAQALAMLFAAPEYLSATGIGNTPIERARLLTDIVMGYLESPGKYRTLYGGIKDTFLFGTSVAELGWEVRRRQQLVEEPILGRSGFVIGRRFRRRDIVYRRGPLFRFLDIYNCFPDPSGTRIQEDMLYFVKRFDITKQQARDLVKAGTYNRDGVERAILRASKKSGKGDSDSRRFEKFEIPTRYGTMTGFEAWAVVPYKHPDGATNRVITVLNGELVRSHINPYADGMFPFKEFVMNPIEGRFYGLSPAEVIRFLQDSTNHFLISMTDAMNMAIRMPMLVGMAFGGDMDRLSRRGPLDNIQCVDINAIKPLQIDLNALQLATVQYLQKKNVMREASGATNPLQAIPARGEQTATESNLLFQMASQRVATMVQMMERDDLPWLAEGIISRFQQFTPDAGLVATLGRKVIPFTPDDIRGRVSVKWVGSTTGRSAQAKLQQITAAISMITSNPDVLLLVPELIVRAIREGLETPDAEQIVATAAQRLAVLKQQQAEAQPGGSPPRPAPQTAGLPA